MELLTEEDILSIAKKRGFNKVLKCEQEDFPDKVAGFLGDHIKLFLDVEENGTSSTLNLFVKCMPRFNEWRAQYIRDLGFFNKEYVMLSQLFNGFENGAGYRKWRPELLFVKENIFVFENVSFYGYVMPHNQITMDFEELKASVETLARFHAQSFIYEERKSKELGRTYRIWEDYSEYLNESTDKTDWRDTGRNAVMDYLKIYSKYKTEPNFNRYIDSILPGLFSEALELMQLSKEYRNAVVHRDLWSNNILVKKEHNSPPHVLFVDFQTVIYTSPLLDLSSLIYFNTTRADRESWTDDLIEIYYSVLFEELQAVGIDLYKIFNKTSIRDAYEKSRLFGITQAALIIPVTVMSKEQSEAIFCDPESARRANVETRSQDFIDFAKKDEKYRARITELFDEIVERYVFPKSCRQVST